MGVAGFDQIFQQLHFRRILSRICGVHIPGRGWFFRARGLVDRSTQSYFPFTINSVALAAAKRTALKATSGKVGALAEITDRVEGRALQALWIAGDDGGPVQMGIERQSLADLRREIKKFRDRIRARALDIE